MRRSCLFTFVTAFAVAAILIRSVHGRCAPALTLVGPPAPIVMEVAATFERGGGPSQRVTVTHIDGGHGGSAVYLTVTPPTDGAGHYICREQILVQCQGSREPEPCGIGRPVWNLSSDESWFHIYLDPAVAMLPQGTYTGALHLVDSGNTEILAIPFQVVIRPVVSVFLVSPLELNFGVRSPGTFESESPVYVLVMANFSNWRVTLTASPLTHKDDPSMTLEYNRFQILVSMLPKSIIGSSPIWGGSLDSSVTELFSGCQGRCVGAEVRFFVDIDYAVRAGEYHGEFLFTFEQF